MSTQAETTRRYDPTPDEAAINRQHWLTQTEWTAKRNGGNPEIYHAKPASPAVTRGVIADTVIFSGRNIDRRATRRIR